MKWFQPPNTYDCGTYRQEGDYLIPNLLPPESSDTPLGKYGYLRRTFLKDHQHGIYTAMLMDGSLWDHLHEQHP